MMQPYIIGIAGGSGSGKTTITHYLLERLCHNKQLINSHFYRGVSELPYKLLLMT